MQTLYIPWMLWTRRRIAIPAATALQLRHKRCKYLVIVCVHPVRFRILDGASGTRDRAAELGLTKPVVLLLCIVPSIAEGELRKQRQGATWKARSPLDSLGDNTRSNGEAYHVRQVYPQTKHVTDTHVSRTVVLIPGHGIRPPTFGTRIRKLDRSY